MTDLTEQQQATYRRVMLAHSAASALRAAGARFMSDTDRGGVRRLGWWLDGVFLGTDALQSVRVMEGKGLDD